MEFVAWPKIPRLKRTVTITEKIDGTNACVVITPQSVYHDDPPEGVPAVTYQVYAQSRTRIIVPTADNFGFAAWVEANKDALIEILGPGRWFGEWWGLGVQRGYGLDHKRFSLFDTRRLDIAEGFGNDLGLYVVPLLDTYTMSDRIIDGALERLRSQGSIAAPGYMNPEGIVVRHSQSGQMYKVLLENDKISKTEAGAA